MLVLRRSLFAILSVLVLSACSDSVEPPDPAATLEIVSGNAQTGVVGTALSAPPTVRVLTARGKAVSGATVSFQASAGSVASVTAVTDAKGTAAAGVWTLGTTAGSQTLVATVTAAPDAPVTPITAVTFTATASAGSAARLNLLTAPASTAVNRAVLSVQPVVQLQDQFGNAVAQAGLTVTASAGGNVRLSNNTAVTDATGTATFSGLTLSGVAAPYQVSFAATGMQGVSSSNLTSLLAGEATRLVLLNGPAPVVASGVAFATQPVLQLVDADSNAVPANGVPVTASLSGAGALNGTTTVTSSAGRATFTNLAYTGSGPFRIAFSAPNITSVNTAELSVGAAPVSACASPRAMALNSAIGTIQRFQLAPGTAPNCLLFDLARNRDQQYLVMFENTPTTGGYDSGIFIGSDPITFQMSVNITAGNPSGMPAAKMVGAEPELPEGMAHAWDFGAGPIYEYEPKMPAGGVPHAYIVRDGERLSVNSSSAAPGDTIVAFLAGVARLGVPSGVQRGIVRLVSDELIIAEDIRLSTLPRAGSPVTYNSPIAQADLEEIARFYGQQAKQQADLVFGGTNAAAAREGDKFVAFHTLMPDANTWGYTYSSTNVFAFDYWIQSNGSTKGLPQQPVKLAHSLFMHEIAHMRHWGLLERAGRTNLRGNRWLVEGFARFTERLASSAYLLNSNDPSRTGNVVLPRYPQFGTTYYRDDVPTFLSMGSSMFNGYDASSFVFDYYADQVADRGGNWRQALANLVVAAGMEADANNAVNAALPGLTFGDVFTRARIALYADDFNSALPRSTQYLQFQLRASRPAGSANAIDPRNEWPRIVPGTTYADARTVFLGAAWGYLIDGTAATANAGIELNGTPGTYGVMSITRLR